MILAVEMSFFVGAMRRIRKDELKIRKCMRISVWFRGQNGVNCGVVEWKKKQKNFDMVLIFLLFFCLFFSIPLSYPNPHWAGESSKENI